ncbi:hypothetical protein Ahy_B05g077680 [Arachis hypogaea]|uniref:SWIM-type domain-containing protein n=1 Tax=Arachis hypogaea TaxID=3818 RepID=A0A444Z5C6_ARAHY|nr:hypothetical protein Ahy_B05g077680 [Arachis hypogaea]
MKHERSWQLKSCNNKHNCSRELKIGIMHAKWLSNVFLNKIAENPKIKLTTLIRKSYTKWNVELTKSKASRVRQFALDELQETYIEQYRRIKVEKQVELNGNWVSVYAGRDRYEVVSIQGKEKFVVDLRNHECSCRKFQLFGIPCAHAMTCIRKMCFNVDTYVADYYKKAAYISCYQHVCSLLMDPTSGTELNLRMCCLPLIENLLGDQRRRGHELLMSNQIRLGCLVKDSNKSVPIVYALVNNAANSTSKGRSRRGVRKSIRLSAKTASSKATESENRKQKGNNNKPSSHPKRKSAASSQQS